MTYYDTREISTVYGADIRLYEFRLGDARWRYCTGDRDQVYGGNVYVAAPINDAGLKQKGQATSDDFVVTMPTGYPIPLRFRGSAPSAAIKLIVRQVQFGDATDAPIMWLGYVASVKVKDEVTSEILCNSQTAFLHRKGNRCAYTRECQHALYDTECRVDKSLWGEDILLTGTTGNSLLFSYVNPPLSGNRDGRFINGFIEWTPLVDGAPQLYLERRAVQVHSETPVSVLLLMGQTDGLAAGMQIKAYPGCNRSPANCVLYNNISNYGGFAMMTGVSPFDGNPVF